MCTAVLRTNFTSLCCSAGNTDISDRTKGRVLGWPELKYIKKYEMMIIFKKGSFDQEDTHELLDSVAYWADVVFLLYRCWLLF